MSLNWTTVLGGSGRPRYLICGAELVDNRGFESNIYGWIGVPSASVSRVEDSETYYGDYSLKLIDTGTQGTYARYAISYGSSLLGKSFALSFYARSATGSCNISARLSAADEDLDLQTKVVSGTQVHFLGIFNFTTSTQEAFDIKIYATDGSSYANTIYIDNVSCREVTYDLYDEFPYHPNTMQPTWELSEMSSDRLIDGSLKEYDRGWELSLSIQYDYLDATTEYYRRLLSEASFVWVQPHYDYAFWIAMKWDRIWEQRYFGNVYAGHVGPMIFRSIYLLENKPLDVS